MVNFFKPLKYCIEATTTQHRATYSSRLISNPQDKAYTQQADLETCLNFVAAEVDSGLAEVAREGSRIGIHRAFEQVEIAEGRFQDILCILVCLWVVGKLEEDKWGDTVGSSCGHPGT